MKRIAKAHWSGNLKLGSGTLSTQSGILENTNYSYKTRFEGDRGTNPEELLAAAHAGCFTMAVSLLISQRGMTPEYLDTQATVTLEGLDITNIHLDITGSVPGITDADFIAITQEAANTCIISKALNVNITTEAHSTITV